MDINLVNEIQPLECPNLKHRICDICKKPLRLIGIQRKNGGSNTTDWCERKYHKKCFIKFITDGLQHI